MDELKKGSRSATGWGGEPDPNVFDRSGKDYGDGTIVPPRRSHERGRTRCDQCLSLHHQRCRRARGRPARVGRRLMGVAHGGEPVMLPSIVQSLCCAHGLTVPEAEELWVRTRTMGEVEATVVAELKAARVVYRQTYGQVPVPVEPGA